MSTRSGRVRAPVKDVSPPRTRKGVSPPRTPTRVRKSSPPARSPSRKSPSRKSPSRKPVSKFPARKSPSRTTKEAIENAAQRSPSKRAAKSEASLNVDEVSTTKPEIYRATRSRRSEYSIRDLSGQSGESEDTVNGIDPLIHSSDIYGLRNRKSVEEILPRRSSRLREFDLLPDIRRSLSKSVSKSVSKSISQSIDTYSDEESGSELRFKKSESVTRKLATPLRESISSKLTAGSRWEFGGRLGSAALLLLMPVTIFLILISCRKSCSAESLSNLNEYKSLPAWFSLTAFIVILSQYVIQAIFAVLQVFGPVKERLDDSGTTHTFNALFSSFVTLNILSSLKYFGIFDDNLLVTNYVKLAVFSYIFAVALSIILFVKSKKFNDSDLNPYGNTGYLLYDFAMGREIHPFIKKLDVKLWISRISNISTLILLTILFRQAFSLPQQEEDNNLTWENAKLTLTKVQIKPTIVIFTMMQLVYILYFIIKEYKITSTFFWQSEGLGYLQLVSSALYPFLFTTVSKFVVDSDLKLPNSILISASVLYLIGLMIMMLSNNLKYEFRRNPLQPGFSNLETMPTFHGKKLLVSGPWGVVRHPNYIGDILVHTALALPGILTGTYIAAAPALLTILVLSHRAWRDHSRCKRRYGAAWERYSKKVPKIFIPKLV